VGYEGYAQPDRAAAAAKVQGPAITLIVTAGLGFLYQLFSIVTSLTGKGMPDLSELPPQLARYVTMMSGTIGVVMSILAIGIGVLVLLGALKMRSLTSYGLALTSSILAMIPCLSPCCCVGLPAGIWALVVLNKADVKAAFQ